MITYYTPYLPHRDDVEVKSDDIKIVIITYICITLYYL